MASSFDEKWFQELASIDERVLAPIDPTRFRPTLNEVWQEGGVSKAFLDTTREFISLIEDEGYVLSPEFRVHEKHIYTFPAKRAFRKQLNIGLWSDGAGRRMRVGVGFKLNADHKPSGWEDYTQFVIAVAEKSQQFDSLLDEIGSYLEPQQLRESPSPANAILGYEADARDDWIFFGALLRFDDEEGGLLSVPLEDIAERTLKVMDRITDSPFGGNVA